MSADVTFWGSDCSPCAIVGAILSMWALVKWLPTVDRVARPSAPPTCCMVFSTPEPTPESSRTHVVHGGQGERHEHRAHAERHQEHERQDLRSSS